MLDLNTTRYYLDCYGTDVSRWPEPEAGKIALAVYTNELGEDLTGAKRLDAALNDVPAASPSDLLARRIMNNLPAQDGVAANDLSVSRWMNWKAVTAVFLAIGAIGVTTLSLQTAPLEPAETAESEIWREAALDMGVDDVFDWVYSEDS